MRIGRMPGGDSKVVTQDSGAGTVSVEIPVLAVCQQSCSHALNRTTESVANWSQSARAPIPLEVAVPSPLNQPPKGRS